MLDHVSIAVTDIAKSIAFYSQALAPLGITRLKSYGGTNEKPDHVGFGSGHKPYLWLGKGEPIRGYVHIALSVPDRAAVDAFYQAALAAGGRDNGPPGPRPHYHERYYGAFVLDPDGCNLEAVHHGF
ncbi:glyoxalase/bleomycin resistance/extradiol dioxygenase family protein [Sphingomonas spermidinifaciens]|uniref:Glyoxalase/bleomycin resistance/extradiol dioxygenase family protein n=1 Tax=Sphingomonas spermidinifaciens TaxID=1141889 RepID=A0A2A4B314_9SPHN|nr:VOC family protein [Sphingomonas spermidinifaciens]PCD02447.1 glyoxalase/bleomycin resistance/extradiol dioxygenase family protein [Sphingomonas spermidinifaciens]